MNVYDVSQWKRCEALAIDYGVTIKLRRGFELTDEHGAMLGVLDTVVEVWAFLCGYEHSRASKKGG
jgi:hypothetical protein